MRLIRTLGIALALACFPAVAQAHPHIWANMVTRLLAAPDGKLTGIRVAWSFDELYSEDAVSGFDANNDGATSEAELRPLADELIRNLVESSYFTHIRQNGSELPQGQVQHYWLKLEDGRMNMAFDLPLQQPADPAKGEVTFKIYDPDYFIAFDYIAEQATGVEGTLAKGCSLNLKPVPTTAELDATRTMLASKGKEWKPDDQEDFGSMFSQPLSIACAS